MQRRFTLGGERGAQIGQFFFAARETGAQQVGDVPDWGEWAVVLAILGPRLWISSAGGYGFGVANPRIRLANVTNMVSCSALDNPMSGWEGGFTA